MSGPATAVTVVIPVWDGYVRFLEEAVRSVRRGAVHVPIVVVDNASGTEVPEFKGCEMVRSDQRLTVGAARNLGLERVVTEYVVFLDADDMLLDGALEFMVSRIARDRTLSIASMSILDGATGKRHRTPRRFVSRLVRRPRAFALANSIWSLLPIQGCAIMRAEQARDAGGYADAQLGDDWVLGVSLAWRGRVVVSERLGRYYRLTEGSIAGRSWTGAELRGNARLVRDRIRQDPGIPSWARTLLPGIAALQLCAILLARPTYRGIRALLRARPPAGSNVR
jgi:glycosyltransferase involved in cell wall biosynthesis